MYINDISDCCVGGTKIIVFADDCKMYVSSPFSRDNLSNSLLNFEKWVSDWQLIITKQK